MSRNGSGVYSLPAGNPVVTNTTISSTWANTTLSDLATAMTGSVASDGQTPMTGSLNLNSNVIANLANPVISTDGANKSYVDTAVAASLGSYLLKASNLSDVANTTTSRTNLSAAKSGANSDITSLTACTTITGLTTALSAAQGGTGLAAVGTAGNLLTSNGSVWVSSPPAVSGVTSLNGQTGAVTTTSVDSIGSTMMLYYGVNGTATPNTVINTSVNTTISGASLRYNPTLNDAVQGTFPYVYQAANSVYGAGGTALSGTWRVMSSQTWFRNNNTGCSYDCFWSPILMVRVS